MSFRFKAAAVALGLVVAAGSFGAASAETVIVKHRPLARTVVVTHPHRIVPRVVTRVGVRRPALVRLAPHRRIGAPRVVIR